MGRKGLRCWRSTQKGGRHRQSTPLSSSDGILSFTGSCLLLAIPIDYSIEEEQKANEKMKQRGPKCQSKKAIASIARPAISTT